MNIKKIIASLLAAACLASFAACSSTEKDEDSSDNKKPPVFESGESSESFESSVSDDSSEGESATGFDASAIKDFSPYISLGKYKGVTIYREKVTDELLNEAIKEKLKTLAEYKEMPTDTVAALDDKVVIDYTGYKLDTMEAFEGGAAKDYELELGSGTFIPGFEEKIVGHKIGETFDIMLTFPADYHNADFANLEVKFTITLDKIKRPEIPALTDETAKQLKYESAAALKNAFVVALEEEARQKNMSAAWDVVMDNTALKAYPEGSIEALSKQYTAFYVEQYSYSAMLVGMELDAYLQLYYGMTEAEFRTDLADKAKTYAEVTVKQRMVMYAIADAEFQRIITEDEYRSHTERYAQKEGMSVEELVKAYGEKVIMESIISDKVMLLVYNNAVMTDIPSSKK